MSHFDIFDHPNYYYLLKIVILGEYYEVPPKELMSRAVAWLKSNFRLRDTKLPAWAYFKPFPHVFADLELLKVMEKAWETLKDDFSLTGIERLS